MTSRADDTAASPLGYADLEPARVLDALDAIGLRGDGRLLQLNSYENRVFQVHLEDGDVVVAKFYRPGRWSDAQIAVTDALERIPPICSIPPAARHAIPLHHPRRELPGRPITFPFAPAGRRSSCPAFRGSSACATPLNR